MGTFLRTLPRGDQQQTWSWAATAPAVTVQRMNASKRQWRNGAGCGPLRSFPSHCAEPAAHDRGSHRPVPAGCSLSAWGRTWKAACACRRTTCCSGRTIDAGKGHTEGCNRTQFLPQATGATYILQALLCRRPHQGYAGPPTLQRGPCKRPWVAPDAARRCGLGQSPADAAPTTRVDGGSPHKGGGLAHVTGGIEMCKLLRGRPRRKSFPHWCRARPARWSDGGLSPSL